MMSKPESPLRLEESISLWVDEPKYLDTEQVDSPYGRQLWEQYHLIGDVMRDEQLAISPSDMFYARVAKAIDEHEAELAQQANTQAVKASAGWQRWLLPASGMAAALVIALWYVQPTSTVPDTAPVLATADDGAWFDYIDAHRSLAGVSPAHYASYVDEDEK